MDNRIVSPEIKNEDDNTLRPKFLKDYVGQTKVKEMVDIYIKAAKKKRWTYRPYFVIRPTRTWKNYISTNNC